MLMTFDMSRQSAYCGENFVDQNTDPMATTNNRSNLNHGKVVGYSDENFTERQQRSTENMSEMRSIIENGKCICRNS